ncbi:Haloacetate dehalogenase H-2 [Planctomycetes bacterium Poly30]|uniref:Haloacetate dehalogenase H-2 n=1 Tax=Saltatorellus ferox TaxID=2528018 RepID=A0A518ESU9_9BACT|nr:Haloacetate dehalogenase H-2 [Planctomycetes bacterium Poly30]
MVTRPDPTWERPLAVLFDLDGTLYDQRPLRRAMLKELACAPLTKGPRGAWKVARCLRAFRIRREDLRDLGDGSEPLRLLQYERPAAELGVPPGVVEKIVEEWMYRKPLRHLGHAGWPRLRATLQALKDAGLKLGVFSDYPPAEKLQALGIADLFDVAIGATDENVNAFKPHAKGFLAGARALGAAPGDVVYVGDRHDLDGAGAEAAGMRHVILETGVSHVGESGEASERTASPRCRTIQDFSEVPHGVGIS